MAAPFPFPAIPPMSAPVAAPPSGVSRPKNACAVTSTARARGRSKHEIETRIYDGADEAHKSVVARQVMKRPGSKL